VIQELEARSRRLERRLESLVFKSVEARTVEALLELSGEVGESCSHGMAIDVRLSQQDLADLIGASRESVNRIVGDLQKPNICDVRVGICAWPIGLNSSG
jgi:CRP/FNR family transcriptional regulator/CRP/FNR family cyclic AMP-dependent transcriptional regulator